MVEINTGNAAEAAKAVKNGDQFPGPSTFRRSATVAKLTAALVKAQAEVQNPTKNKANPHFKSTYADLPAVLEAVVPVLNAHGLAVCQLLSEYAGYPALTTVLTHESGEFYESTINLRPAKTDPQGVGSAITYLRRYSLLALAGVAADDDDDGNAACRPPAGRSAEPPMPPRPAPPPPKTPNDKARVAKYAQDIAQAADMTALKGVGAAIKIDFDGGHLTAAGKDHLTGIWKQRQDELQGAAA